MANFREYSARIKSVGGMRRVTATMKMVSASHLHRGQNELARPEPFAAALRSLRPMLKKLPFASHRVCAAPPRKGSRVLLLVLTANRGLCGSFNYAIARAVRQWVRQQRANRAIVPEAIYIGLKGHQMLKAEIEPCMPVVSAMSHPKSKETSMISRFVCDGFLNGQYHEVWVAGNRFQSAVSVEPQFRRVLPLDPERLGRALADSEEAVKTILEPADSSMIDALTRQWVHLDTYTALLHSVAGEHASRVIAMDNATTNLTRMGRELTLLRNRARQEAITRELTEIVSGAEILG